MMHCSRCQAQAMLMLFLLTLALGHSDAARSLSSVTPTASIPISIGGTKPPVTSGVSTTLCYRNEASPTTIIQQNVDIFFLADTTGSMGGSIAGVKAKIVSIMNDITAVAPLAKFGVGEYKDELAYCSSDPFVYRTNQDPTDNAALVLAGVNAWSANGGCDLPEAQLFALHQVATTVPFRAGAQKLVVWFGDAMGHDPSNGVTLVQARDALISAGIKVVAINTGALDGSAQASTLAAATGGAYFNLGGDSIADSIIRAVTTTLSRDITLKKPTVSCRLYDSSIISSTVSIPTPGNSWPVTVQSGQQICFNVTFFATGQCVELHDTCAVTHHTTRVVNGTDTGDFVDSPIPSYTFTATVLKKPAETYTLQTAMLDPCKFPFPKDTCPFYPYCGLDQYAPECNDPILSAGCSCPPCPTIATAYSFAKAIVGPGTCKVTSTSFVYASSISVNDFKAAINTVKAEIKSYCSANATADITSTASAVANQLATATATSILRYAQVITCNACYRQPFFAAVNVAGISQAVATALATSYQEAFAGVDNCGDTWQAYAYAQGHAFAQSTQLAVAELLDQWKTAGGNATLCNSNVNVVSNIIKTKVAKALSCVIVDVLSSAYYDESFPDYPTGFAGACTCSVAVAGTDANVPDTTVCPRSCPSAQGTVTTGTSCTNCPSDYASFGLCVV